LKEFLILVNDPGNGNLPQALLGFLLLLLIPSIISHKNISNNTPGWKESIKWTEDIFGIIQENSN
jgi:hypothetical protein